MNILSWVCIVLAFILIIAGFCWTFLYEMPSAPINKEAWQEGALRGDFWGGHLTAITSFAGTLLFLAGLLFQTSELKLQREDINLSRKISEKQATELEKQTKIAKHQSIVSQIIEIANYCNNLKKEVDVLLDELPTMQDKASHIKRISSLKYRILACDFSHRRLLQSDVLTESEKELFADMVDSGKAGDDYELTLKE
ncbi:hypothetical protein [Gimesia algae]|uniref:Uncharacterized protein n=1 Tax=Gimesia algae TaxID=2527971 RepID=A0A517VD92_9PLAN|nr:hypothetical protein [Gimesia algae]QDT90970.1 hypothetical protein Pan161_26240 [Gimesia algae]